MVRDDMMIKQGELEMKRTASRLRSGRVGTIGTLKRIGTYLWIGIINPGPPPLPDVRAKSSKVVAEK